ncbi:MULTISPECIES: hypothetical protein [unclassified Cyanobium]|nr:MULTISPECIES: hypothetical protein [unclassified Cyanobium]
MAKSACFGRVFPAEAELWQQQRNPLVVIQLMVLIGHKTILLRIV